MQEAIIQLLASIGRLACVCGKLAQFCGALTKQYISYKDMVYCGKTLFNTDTRLSCCAFVLLLCKAAEHSSQVGFVHTWLRG